jgi:hypothetical protein
MPLTLTGKKGRPMAKPKTMGKTLENGRDGSLKAGPITFGPKPKGYPTIRTPIPSEK